MGIFLLQFRRSVCITVLVLKTSFEGGEKGSKFLNYILFRSWQKSHVLPKIIKCKIYPLNPLPANVENVLSSE